MKGLMIVELKGFSEISNHLVHRMDKLGLKDTQVRLKYRNIMSSIINHVSTHYRSIGIKEIGGDTWVVEFNSLKTAIKSAYYVLNLTYNEVVKTGLYYLKPVIAVGEANTIFEGERFLDDESISIYRVADSGDPFGLYVVNPPSDQANLIEPKLNSKLKLLNDKILFKEIEWMLLEIEEKILQTSSSFYLSSILHENDIAFFKSNLESVKKFIELQNESTKIFAFGGPVRFKKDPYDDYVKSIFTLLKNKNCKCFVLSYINPLNTKVNNYYWLKLCQIFIKEFPSKFTFCYYEVDTRKVKPLSYHIYNEEYIQLVLRNYNPSEDESILSSTILIRNRMLAEKFINEFLENFRRIPNSTVTTLETYLKTIDIEEQEVNEINEHILKLRVS